MLDIILLLYILITAINLSMTMQS